MSDEKKYIWRWELPDDWEPDGVWCVQLNIPAGQQYMDAFTGAVGLLTKSKSWERDPTRTGAKTVAATWEKVLYNSPFQVQENCIIVPPVPIPDQAAADDAATAVIRGFLHAVVNQLNTCAPSAEYCGACVDDLFASLEPYGASEAIKGPLTRLCNDLNAAGPARADYETDCKLFPVFDNMRQKIVEHSLDWIDRMPEFFNDMWNLTNDALIYDMTSLAGAIAGASLMGWLNDHGGIPPGDGAGFGTDCGWRHTFDFTEGSQGWSIGNNGHLDAQGFVADYHCFGGSAYNTLQIEQLIDPRIIRAIEIRYTCDAGHIDLPFLGAFIELYNNGLAGFSVTRIPIFTGGDRATWTGELNSAGLGFDCLVGHIAFSCGSDPGGSLTISEMTVWGEGTDPF